MYLLTLLGLWVFRHRYEHQIVKCKQVSGGLRINNIQAFLESSLMRNRLIYIRNEVILQKEESRESR